MSVNGLKNKLLAQILSMAAHRCYISLIVSLSVHGPPGSYHSNGSMQTVSLFTKVHEPGTV